MRNVFSDTSTDQKVKVMMSWNVFVLIWSPSSNINNLHPSCSIVLGDFNAKCSKLCASDKNNTAVIELDNITTTPAYN